MLQCRARKGSNYLVASCNSDKKITLPYQRPVLLPQGSPFDLANKEIDALKNAQTEETDADTVQQN